MDEFTGVPERVRKEAVEAEAIAESMAAAEKREAEGGETPAAPTPEETPAEKADTPIEAPAEEKPEPEPEQKPEPAQTVDAREHNRLKSEYGRLKKAHETLQGKYTLEVPRFAKELKDAKARIAELEAALTQKPDTKETTPDYELTEDERELGPEVESLAKKVAGAQISALQKQIRDLEARLGTAKADAPEPEPPPADQTMQAVFYDLLASDVPDWKAINKSQEFFDWLQNRDPGQSMTRHQLLNEAAASLRANIVAEIFNAYKDSQGTKGGSSTPSLAAQAAPKTVAKETKPAARTYTLKEYSDNMDKIAKGGLSPERRQTLLKEMEAAERQNRIVG